MTLDGEKEDGAEDRRVLYITMTAKEIVLAGVKNDKKRIALKNQNASKSQRLSPLAFSLHLRR